MMQPTWKVAQTLTSIRARKHALPDPLINEADLRRSASFDVSLFEQITGVSPAGKAYTAVDP